MGGHGRSVLSLLVLTASMLMRTASAAAQTPRPQPQLPPNETRTQFPIHLKNRAGSGVRILEAGTLSSPGPTIPATPSNKDIAGLGHASSSHAEDNESGEDEDEMQVAADTLLYSRRPGYYSRPLPTIPFPAPVPTSAPQPQPPPPPPPPAPGPVGPPIISPTQVPILVPGGGMENEILPPSPPTSGVLPPSPPPLRSAFAARQLPPIRRPVGGVQKTNVIRNNLRTPQTRATTTTTTTPDPNIITDYVFSDIKCFRTKQKEYFGAKIHMRSGFHLPYVRDRPERDVMTSHECHMDRAESPDTFHLKMTDLRACGVEQCGDSMCVTMVFPRLPLLALADDEVTTIKCAPQKSQISEIRTISFAGDSGMEARRSGSTVEGGGQDFAAEVGVFRQNAGTNNGLFVKRVNSGGVVQLGERLQLRSVVRGGDGWTFSRLTDVKVWRMRESYSSRMEEELDPKDASEVITLVDGAGCRNSDYQVIAESDPLRDPRNDLVHHFTFKAFLFRGQRANEPLIVTAKVQACQERDDCQIVNCKSGGGDERDEGRYRRWVDESSAEVRNRSGRSLDWSSQMALHVVPLHDPSASPIPVQENNPPRNESISESCVDKMAMSAFVGSFIMLLLSTLILTLISFCRRGRRLQGLQKRLVDSATTTVAPPQPTRSKPDYVRKPSDFVRTAPSGEGSQLASLLQKLHSDTDSGVNHGFRTGNEPESTADGVYIVYCPKMGGSRRAKSAPPSVTSQEAESEEDWTRDDSGSRRTVRSVKRTQRRREEQGLRKNRRPAAAGGSYPSRVKGTTTRSVSGSKSVPEFSREAGTRSVRLPRSNYQFDQESPLSSEEMESAYFSSSTSSHKGGQGHSIRSELVEAKACGKFPEIPPPLPPPNPTRGGVKSTSHFVTRNETSTRILIIPETNV